MNTTAPTTRLEINARRRRRWPWVVGGCLAPFVILGAMAASCLSLDGDAAALREHVTRATGAHWSTKVQISVGRVTLGGVRGGLRFLEHADAEKARLALRAVTRASVGVYTRDAIEHGDTLGQLLAVTDRAMRRRGWSRVVGFSGKGEAVLAYVPVDNGSARELEICLAVMKRRELVVVSALIDADAVAEFIQQHLPEELSSKFQRQLRTAAHGAATSVAR